MIQQCIDLATFRAFAPDTVDTTVPLARRFAHKPLIAVTVFKDSLEFVTVTFADGKPEFGTPQACPAAGEDADADALRAFADRNKARDCLINLATGYTAVLSSRTRRPDTDEEAILVMRDNPERLLGEAPAHGCRPSIAYHPTHNFAVVFSHKENEIGSAVVLAQKAGLGLARLHCGMASLVNHIIGNHWDAVRGEAELLLIDRASVFYLPAAEGSLGRPLFDVGLKESALKQAITERVAKLKPGGNVVLVNASGMDVEAMIRDRNMNDTVVTPLKDSPQPVLFACCSDRPRLAYDLFPAERIVRPFAPASLKPVPLALWGTTVIAVLLIGLNAFRQTRSDSLMQSLTNQARMLEAGQKQQQTKMQEVLARGRTASDLADWLLLSPMTQTLLVNITHEIEAATNEGLKENKPVAQVDSMSISREEGQPQMRFAIVLTGDSSAANRIFQRISALFSRLGYSTVDLRESVAPQGYRYEHLVNLPKEGGA